jgi:S-adenosyl-L-methionine hydrolase (adenosine-forming)
MIVLFTDYGTGDPYVGQVKAVLAQHAGAQPIIDLLHEVPSFNPHAGAHLLAALVPRFPPGSVFFAVVDPGVGTPRDAVVMVADGSWFVGPDNGLLSVVAGRAQSTVQWRIAWRPEGLSDSFHGRDLFAPIAAWVAAGRFPEDKLVQIPALHVRFDTGDLARVIYIDHYGNCHTGLRGAHVDHAVTLRINGRDIAHRRVFAEGEKNEPFWYVNSLGLLEIAVNRGSAAVALGLKIGDPVSLPGSPGNRLH